MTHKHRKRLAGTLDPNPQEKNLSSLSLSLFFSWGKSKREKQTERTCFTSVFFFPLEKMDQKDRHTRQCCDCERTAHWEKGEANIFPKKLFFYEKKDSLVCKTCTADRLKPVRLVACLSTMLSLVRREGESSIDMKMLEDVMQTRFANQECGYGTECYRVACYRVDDDIARMSYALYQTDEFRDKHPIVLQASAYLRLDRGECVFTPERSHPKKIPTWDEWKKSHVFAKF
jgi:hypothetical protein